MSEKKTLYEVLGVSKDADESEIKRAYRSLSLVYHPDRNSDEDAKSKFQEISSAYERLKDPASRDDYDMELENPFQRMNSMGGGQGMDDINQIFSMFFGGGMPPGMGMPGMGMPGMGMPPGMGGPHIRVFHNGQQMGGQGFPSGFHQGGFPPGFLPPGFRQIEKPQAVVKTVQITLEQCFNGCVVPIDIERWVQQDQLRISEINTLNVSIPPGITETEIITLEGLGNCINEQIKGDVKIGIKIQNTSVFQRCDMDLLLRKKITLKDALCGFSFEIAHLNGKSLILNNFSTVIRPNFKKVIPNLGMIKDGRANGSMIIEFDIEFPDTLTPEQLEGLKTLL